MRKIVHWAIDGEPRYWKALWLAVHMFKLFHTGWELRVTMLHPDHYKADRLRGMGVEVFEQARFLTLPNGQENIYIPTARVRCNMLAEIPKDALLLYLDVDGLVLGSFEPIIDDMLKRGLEFAIGREDDPRFHHSLIASGFHPDKIPQRWFPRQGVWWNRSMVNTGMVVATGEGGARIGRLSADAYPDCEPVIRMGEQGIIGAALYELEVPYRNLEVHEHCTMFEGVINHTGRPYIDPSTVDGKPITFRHFCSVENKDALFVRVSRLAKHYGLSCP